MSSNSGFNEDVDRLVEDIIAKYSWSPVSDIKYQHGAAAGDGYFSKTVAVDITSAKGTFHLFLKCIINVKSIDLVPIIKMYENEIYFYDVIHPTFQNFLKERSVDDGFRNAPMCYGTLDRKILALENLRNKGFTLFDREQIMNDNHITTVLKTFAKLHAVSFAIKDQDKPTYDTLSKNISNVFGETSGEPPVVKMFKETMNNFFVKLDPVEDKDILDRCNANDLAQYFANSVKFSDEYSVLTQGDCWCNNMMFLYKENDTQNPIDVMLIDWQILRFASAMYDISFFFYTSASQESLSKLQHYLKLYHDELSKQIKQLGSDPKNYTLSKLCKKSGKNIADMDLSSLLTM